MRDPDIRFFRRTSTDVVFDIIASGHDTFEKTKREMKTRGHKRRDSDIKYMASYLERIDLVEDYELTDFGKTVKSFAEAMNFIVKEKEKGRKIPKLFVQEATQKGKHILSTLYRQGFLLLPFLKAINEPRVNKMIAARFFQECMNLGYYNINAETDYNDFVPAMKNFAVYLGFAERLSARGKVMLSDFAREILNLEQEIIKDRKKCDVELCRQVCPAGAIHCDYIKNCINCGLCARCCPYGAISCSSSSVDFNFSICETHHNTIRPNICNLKPDLDEMIAYEPYMQQWILNLLKINKIEAIIPGPGRKPDIVINRAQNSTIIECKNDPITGKKLERLKKQLNMYMEVDNIADLKDYLTNWNFNLRDPDVYFLIAPEKTDVHEFFNIVRGKLPYPVSFISTEALFTVHKKILKKKRLDSDYLVNMFELTDRDLSTEIINTPII